MGACKVGVGVQGTRRPVVSQTPAVCLPLFCSPYLIIPLSLLLNVAPLFPAMPAVGLEGREYFLPG